MPSISLRLVSIKVKLVLEQTLTCQNGFRPTFNRTEDTFYFQDHDINMKTKIKLRVHGNYHQQS